MATKKVLVVVFDNLGDVVMATGLVPALRRHLPGAEVGFWTKRYSGRVLAERGLEHLHAADPFWTKAPGQSRGGVADFLRSAAQVRAARYDAALVLNTEWRRAMACALSGVPRRIGFDRRKSGWLLTETLTQPPAEHMVDDHRMVLERLLGGPVPPAECLPRLVFSESDRHAGSGWVARQGWQDRDIFLLHPFSGDPSRCWPLPRWCDLMRRLAEGSSRARFAIACSPGEMPALQPHLARLPHGLASGVVPLEEVQGALSLARAFVGGDSGIGHMAAAFGVPMVSLIGPASHPRHAVRGAGRIRLLRTDSLPGLGADAVAAEMQALLT